MPLRQLPALCSCASVCAPSSSEGPTDGPYAARRKNVAATSHTISLLFPTGHSFSFSHPALHGLVAPSPSADYQSLSLGAIKHCQPTIHPSPSRSVNLSMPRACNWFCSNYFSQCLSSIHTPTYYTHTLSIHHSCSIDR